MSHCRRCETELAHCHGTLVRHDDGIWECTADQGAGVAGCVGDVEAHDFVIGCAEAWAGCCAESFALPAVWAQSA